MSFYEDAAGTLWIGTHGGGLCRFQDGRFATVTTRDGLYDGLAFSILEDAAGNFWMSGNKGVYRARRRDLEACADGRTHHVDSVAYGAADGMLSRECSGGAAARAAQAGISQFLDLGAGLPAHPAVHEAVRAVIPPSFTLPVSTGWAGSETSYCFSSPVAQHET